MPDSKLSNDFEISFHGEYLRVLHPDDFEITPETNQKVWQAINEACKTHKCLRVLSEGKINQRKMKTWNAHESGSQSGGIRGLRLACLFYDYKPDEMSEFFKTVSANRGVKIEFFTDKSAALEWLGVKEK